MRGVLTAGVAGVKTCVVCGAVLTNLADTVCPKCQAGDAQARKTLQEESRRDAEVVSEAREILERERSRELTSLWEADRSIRALQSAHDRLQRRIKEARGRGWSLIPHLIESDERKRGRAEAETIADRRAEVLDDIGKLAEQRDALAARLVEVELAYDELAEQEAGERTGPRRHASAECDDSLPVSSHDGPIREHRLQVREAPGQARDWVVAVAESLAAGAAAGRDVVDLPDSAPAPARQANGTRFDPHGTYLFLEHARVVYPSGSVPSERTLYLGLVTADGGGAVGLTGVYVDGCRVCLPPLALAQEIGRHLPPMFDDVDVEDLPARIGPAPGWFDRGRLLRAWRVKLPDPSAPDPPAS